MKILILGGTYFLGRAFLKELLTGDTVEKTSLSVTLFNRGTRPLPFEIHEYAKNKGIELKEIAGDRKDAAAIENIPDGHFDVIVDFCGYDEGDIRLVTENLKASFFQYIFVSTCDVYRRGNGGYIDETGEFEDRSFGGEAGEYITGKVALEKELPKAVSEKGAVWTSIRPAFIYGPYNYAPREGIYFRWIDNAGQIISPSDSEGHFRMVYVRDAAKAIAMCAGNSKAYNRALNLAGDEKLTYEGFSEILRKATGKDFTEIKLPVADIYGREIPLPFPLTKEESEDYDGRTVKSVLEGFSYTPVEEGMAETYRS
ncbi:MAG: NAD-dependent epimerase/dehydratase family protein [Lachnospiraceae bacterium]|nr:NAD-dependent epimerase/dehydratase family protein [Lachnospiraceae bacterium]